MAGELHNEEEFYQDKGWPTEEYSLCRYELPVLGEDAEGADFDQFALIVNAIYPYIRLTKRRGNSHIPCGCALSPATDGWFANKPEQERDKWCPKIAWGFAAVFLANLRYDSAQKDYVLLKDLSELIRNFYDKYLKMYLRCHNGLKYKGLSPDQKELNFLEEHGALIKSFWEKSEPLKVYADLYDYAKDAEADYENFLQARQAAILARKELKVDSLNDKGGNRIINQNGEKSVYVENNTGTIVIGADSERLAAKAHKNEAYFNDIATLIIKDLDEARVSILVAIAWFTNQQIADKLVEKFKERLDVKVIFYDDHTNSKFGVNIDSIPFKAIRGTRGGIMYNKFCVIDNQKVITGSYNWSENAENKNDENAALVYDNDCASSYSVEFRRLFNSSEKK